MEETGARIAGTCIDQDGQDLGGVSSNSRVGAKECGWASNVAQSVVVVVFQTAARVGSCKVTETARCELLIMRVPEMEG